MLILEGNMQGSYAGHGQLVLLTCLITCTILSCSKFSNTVLPDVSIKQNGLGVADAQSPNGQLLGYWTFYVSADRKTVEAVPVRTADLHLNVVKLLEGKACGECLKISNVHITPSDRLLVDLTLIHPFPGLVKYTGFDVRSILMTGSDYLFPVSGRRISWTGNHIRMLDPDGYTSLFNPIEYPESNPGPPALKYIPGHFAPGGDLTATLNPFACFKKDNQRRMFDAGTSETKTICLALVPGKLQFGYAIDACWAPVDGQINNPLTDFPPSANCLEAYSLLPIQGPGLKPLAGSTAWFQVIIKDHQGLDTISTVSLECPDLFDGTVEMELSAYADEGAVFKSNITNSKGAPEGDYPLLIRAMDWESDANLGKIDAWDITDIKVTKSGFPIGDLVYMPEASTPDKYFYMGADTTVDPEGIEGDNGDYLNVPGHYHPTGAYYISKYELTYREFAPFVLSGDYWNPIFWSEAGWQAKQKSGTTYPWMWPGYLNNDEPQSCPVPISYYEAEAFCNWVGGRLPTEPEWERAARGDQNKDRGDNDHRTYPWGNNLDPSKFAEFHLSPVGSFSPAGDSPWGISDCSGNEEEWTSDWWNSKIYYQYASEDFTPPPFPPPDWQGLHWKVTRGGDSGSGFPRTYKCANRQRKPAEDFNTCTGVRVVFDTN